jgi:hypothetical protein
MALGQLGAPMVMLILSGYEIKSQTTLQKESAGNGQNKRKMVFVVLLVCFNNFSGSRERAAI